MALNTLTAVFARLTVVTNTQTSPLHLQKWATSLLCMRESVEEKSVWTNCEYWSSRSWCWGSVCFTSAFSTLWTCHKVQRISAIKQLKYTTCQICHIVWGMYPQVHALTITPPGQIIYFPPARSPRLDKPLVCDAWPVWRQTYGYLPSCRASPPLDRYQIILPGDRDRRVWTTCPRLLPESGTIGGVKHATSELWVQCNQHYTSRMEKLTYRES